MGVKTGFQTRRPQVELLTRVSVKRASTVFSPRNELWGLSLAYLNRNRQQSAHFCGVALKLGQMNTAGTIRTL